MPDTPHPQAPADDARIDASSVTLRWTPVDDADNYELQLAADEAFDDPLFEGRVGDLQSFTYSGLSPEAGQLFWRVRAHIGDTWTDYGPVATFEIEDWRSSADASATPATVDADALEGPSGSDGVEGSSGPLWMMITVVATVVFSGVLYLLIDTDGAATQATRVERDTTAIDRYGVVDEEEGVYQIPIDSAMKQVVEAERIASPDSL